MSPAPKMAAATPKKTFAPGEVILEIVSDAVLTGLFFFVL